MIEIEVQNETHQTQDRLRFAAVPRIGEGIRLREPDGCWASYDVLDVWYQKAEFGDVWVPYLHVCMTPDEQPAAPPAPPAQAARAPGPGGAPRSPLADRPAGPDAAIWGEEEVPPFTG
ncbi:hypothetical protein [Pelagerythrobacter marinus]|uniref:hypothetical protein n=1 Tax=Pelagerythrobacter marinus TaxID=538382 RepID=UPI0019296AF7|nr:hypothetical protein [Pelagerythrobacter marinus]USA38788.1 hypothetical protein NCF86_10770 [Pelagerythrobacter marinus]WPZ07136.1 hypothetical protein T8T98_01055 [Pelagerythrobacter marinus]